MKEYINQIFYEGLGYSLYVPVENVLNKFSNKKVTKVLINIYKVIYFILSILIALIILYIKI